jgi:hypothetical protein
MTKPSAEQVEKARSLGRFWQWGEGQVQMVASALAEEARAERGRIVASIKSWPEPVNLSELAAWGYSLGREAIIDAIRAGDEG